MSRINCKSSMGYNIIKCYIDPTAIVEMDAIVWDFARVLANAVIGRRCSIGGGTEIGRGSKIGQGSRIGANVFLPPNTVIGERVFVGPGVVCTDDRHPRVPQAGDPPYTAEPPVIEDDAVIGAAVVLLPGVRIGKGAFVAAASVVTSDVAPGSMVRGSPARVFTPSDRTRVAYLRATG